MFEIPPPLQDKLKPLVDKLEPALKVWREQGLPVVRQVGGQVWDQLRALSGEMAEKMAKAGPQGSVGNAFRHLCVVGLNRSELLLQGESQSVFGDSWQELADESLRRHVGLIFFAPRGLDGRPVNPYLFLTGELANAVADEEGLADTNAIQLAANMVGPMPLLDFCRMPPAEPNTVNVLLAADVLFHWDIKDNYVLTTTPTTWVRDVEQVLKSYPRTTKMVIYTQWDTDVLPPSERIKILRLRELPLDTAVWLNQPTFQEKYGLHILVAGMVFLGLVFAGLWLQGRGNASVADELRLGEQQIPRGGQFNDIEKAIGEQEKMFAKRELMGLVVRDMARAVAKSEMKITSFEVKVAEQNEVPKQYLVTIDADAAAYQGWLQQEPIARSLLMNSAVLDAVRKPPTPNGFKLEGLVDAQGLQREYRRVAPRVAGNEISPTTALEVKP